MRRTVAFTRVHLVTQRPLPTRPSDACPADEPNNAFVSACGFWLAAACESLVAVTATAKIAFMTDLPCPLDGEGCPQTDPLPSVN